MQLTIGGPEQVVSAFLNLWLKIRETTDPAVQKKWDALVLRDYEWLRGKLGIPGAEDPPATQTPATPATK